MRDSDTFTIAHYVPSLVLMHRAAMGVFLAVNWTNPAAIVVGSGNNGGDGFALACILKDHHLPCCVFTVSHKFSDDSAHYAEKAKSLGVPIQSYTPGCLDSYKIIVDCLLGTGFQGILRETYKTVIRDINASDAYVISADINSGLNGDTGIGEEAVFSDLTVTIGYVKKGLIAKHVGRYIKRLVCADIGIHLLKEEDFLCSALEFHQLCQLHNQDASKASICIDGHIYSPSPDWLSDEIIISL